MAISETARLIASLELKDLFSKTTDKALKDLDRVDHKLDTTQSRAYKAGTQIGTGIKRGLAIAGGALVGFSVLFEKSLQSASDLNESVSKVGVVFGRAAPSILAFGKNASSALGLSEQAADEAAATFGNLFVALKLPQTASVEMSKKLVTLAADLASFNNVDPTEALDALRSGLVGESEPLRKFGVNLSETTLKAEAVKLGLVTLAKGQKTYTAVLDPATKAQAAYALILEQTKTAQGDFGRTSTGMANQLRILKANWENFKATLATPALPAVSNILQKINALLKENQPAVAAFGKSIADLLSKDNIDAAFGFLARSFDTIKTVAPVLERSAEATFTIVKAAVDLFNTLPEGIKELAVGAFAINKLTGGLVTNIAGGLLDLATKARGATPANPVFVSDVGAGLGGAVGAAGEAAGGGLLGKALSLLPATAIAAAIVTAAVPIGTAFASALPDWLKGPGGQGKTQSQEAAEFLARQRSAGLANPILDRGGREQGSAGIFGNITGTIRKSIQAGIDAVRHGFGDMIKALKTAKTDKEIAKAVRDAVERVTKKNQGSVDATKQTVAGLKAALQRTHDPKLQAEIKAALAKVQAKIPGREYAQRQIAKADKLIADGKVTNSDLLKIHAIERDLKNRGLPHAASVIATKVNTKSNEIITAQQATTAAVKAQSVLLTIQNAVTVSLRSLLNSQQTQTAFEHNR